MNKIYETTNQNNTVTRNSPSKLFQLLRIIAQNQKYLLYLRPFIWNCLPDQMRLNCQSMMSKRKKNITVRKKTRYLYRLQVNYHCHRLILIMELWYNSRYEQSYIQSFPFNVCDRMHTGQHSHNQFDASKKYYEPLLLTLIVQDIRTKKMKEKTKTSNLIVDHFYLTFHQLECCNSMYDFRIRENSQFGVNTIIDLAYISLLVYLLQNHSKAT